MTVVGIAPTALTALGIHLAQKYSPGLNLDIIQKAILYSPAATWGFLASGILPDSGYGTILGALSDYRGYRTEQKICDSHIARLKKEQ